MAGTRVEKIGSIYTRVRGLLLSGALKHSERPLWYDVYETFPPLVEPKVKKWSEVSETPASNEPRNIIYREDFIRAKFYDKYGTVGVIDLKDNSATTVSQRFVQICWDLNEKGMDIQEIFGAADEILKKEGYTLKTLAEIEEEKAAKLKEAQEKNLKQKAPSLDVTEIFGIKASPSSLADEPDTMSEVDPDPQNVQPKS